MCATKHSLSRFLTKRTDTLNLRHEKYIDSEVDFKAIGKNRVLVPEVSGSLRHICVGNSKCRREGENRIIKVYFESARIYSQSPTSDAFKRPQSKKLPL